MDTTITAKPLPYDYHALEPAMSAETLTFHHDKHYLGYVNKLNELIVGTPFERMSLDGIVRRSAGAIFNNAAQVQNHEFYFEQLSYQPKSEPTGRLMEAIAARFGSLDSLKEHMLSSALSLFGSGWVWLVSNEEGELTIINESNAGTPITHSITPLLTIDVWEHAYYIDYRNNRAEAVGMFWNIVDWAVIEQRYRS